MTDSGPPEMKLPDPAIWAKSMAEIAEKSQRLVSEFLARQAEGAGSGMADPLNIGGAFLEMTQRLMSDPGRMVEAQLSLWQDYMRLWQSTAERFIGGNPDAGGRA